MTCSRDDLCPYLCFVLVSPFVSLTQTDRKTQTHVSQRLLGEEPSMHSFWVNIPTLDFICVSALSCFWNTSSGVGSPEPVDIWQPNAGPAPRGGGQKDGTDWAREEGRQRAQLGLAGQRWGLMQSARTAPWVRAGEAPFLKSRSPALLILAPWVLEEISPRGLLSPGNLPQGLGY